MKYIVYHGGCQDGFAAAWIASLVDADATFSAEKHHTWFITKYLIEHANKDDEILYLDICPPRDLLIQLKSKVNNLKVWDHHQTTEKSCGDLDYVTIDQTRCGASLAFSKFFPKLPVPFSIRVIEDIDLWRNTVPDSSKYILFINMLKQDFDVYTKALAWLENEETREEILYACENYLTYKEFTIRKIMRPNAIHAFTITNIKFLAINSSQFQSEIGSHLAERTKLPVAIYHYQDGWWWVSLRSAQGSECDVALIAEKMGGGGHKHAAAFRIDDLSKLKQEPQTMVSQFEEFRNA